MASGTYSRYEGVWKRLQSDWYTDPDRFTVATPPDPRHGDKSDAPAPLMMDAPILQDGGEIVTDVNSELWSFPPVSLPIDNTPVSGNGTPEASGHGFGGLTTPGASIEKLAFWRGIKTGADKRATSSSPVYHFFNENFFTARSKGFEPPPITQRPGGDPVLRRGINGYPDNDGDGGRPTAWSVDQDIEIVGGTWRRGDYEQSNVQRRYAPPNRRHGEVKVVEADIVTIIGDVPPPEKPDTYASPFSSLQKFRPKRRKIAGNRIDPGPIDEDLMADQIPVTTIRSADGMVAN